MTEARVGPLAGSRFEPDLGIVRLSRRQVQALRSFEEAAEAAVEDAAAVESLRQLGAITQKGVHPALASVAALLRAARCQVWLRQWFAGRRRVIEFVCGPDGILVLPDGADPDTPQDLRFEADPGGLAAVLAALIDLSALRSMPHVPDEPIAWPELVSIGSAEPPSWASSQLGTAEGSVHDVRWQWIDESTDHSALVLVRIGDAGWVQVGPATTDYRPTGPGEASDDQPTNPGEVWCSLHPRLPEEIWLGLCRLARMALTGVEPD